MFTGIVEDMGTVVGWRATGKDGGWMLTIQPDHPALFFEDATALTYLGASICVSGVCLTVVRFDSTTLEFGVAPETVRRTNFGDFDESGSCRVNLERASLASGRNSGHYVQGHVDCYGVVEKRVEEKDSVWLTIKLNEKTAGIVPKGFIAVEGTSLTVCEVGGDWFTLMMIDHTQRHVVCKLVGSKVNLEMDVMSKYATSATGELQAKVAALEALVGTLQARLERVEEDNKNKRVKQGE